MSNIGGPGGAGINETTARPDHVPTNLSADTWFKECSSPGAQDGTHLQAQFFNWLLAQIRRAVRGMGVAGSETDDNLLLKAIQSADTPLGSSGAGVPVYGNRREGVEIIRTLKGVGGISVALDGDTLLISYDGSGGTTGGGDTGGGGTGACSVGTNGDIYSDGVVILNGYGVDYKTPGTYNLTVPANVTQLLAHALGGGGGGAPGVYLDNGDGDDTALDYQSGSGGGGGGAAEKTMVVTPGQVIAIIVGDGGARGIGANGANGSDSSVDATIIGRGGEKAEGSNLVGGGNFGHGGSGEGGDATWVGAQGQGTVAGGTPFGNRLGGLGGGLLAPQTGNPGNGGNGAPPSNPAQIGYSTDGRDGQVRITWGCA